MPVIPSSDISLFATVAAELQLTGTPLSMKNIYATGLTAGIVSAGSFHNLTMTPSNSVLFRTAIYSPANNSVDLKLSNWVNYLHDANAIIDVYINDNTGGTVDADVTVYISNGPNGQQFSFIGTTINPTSGNLAFPDYDTGAAAYANFQSSGYFLDVQVNIANKGSSTSLDFFCSDTDGVGAGQTRETYTDVNGSWSTMNSVFNDNAAAVQWNATPGIPWNKRSTLTIQFS